MYKTVKEFEVGDLISTGYYVYEVAAEYGLIVRYMHDGTPSNSGPSIMCYQDYWGKQFKLWQRPDNRKGLAKFISNMEEKYAM